MEYSDNAIVKNRKFSGECDIVYREEEGRFVIIKKPSASGAGIAVGVMFGAIGRAVMDSVSTGEELVNFTPRDVLQVETQEKRSKVIYTVYLSGANDPLTITIGKKKQLYPILQRELVERKSALPESAPVTRMPVAPMEPEPYEPPAPAPQPVQPVAPAQPIAPPQPVVPPQPVAPQQPVSFIQPAAPVQPMAPIQPAAPVQPMSYGQPQPMAPMQPPMQPQPVQPQRPAAPQPRMPRAWLSLRSGPMAGRVFDFAPGTRVVIGRDPARCNLPLSRYNNVSGAHCCVEVGNGCLRVTDLGSTNGTYINTTRLQPNQPVIIRPGDMIKLANDSCIFQFAFQ